MVEAASSRSDPRGEPNTRDVGHSVAERLSALQALNSKELRSEWRRLFRSSPPSLSRDLVVRAIAYKIQELVHGGLSRTKSRQLASLAATLRTGGQISPAVRPQIKPGARLVREWHGRTHVVTVTDGGFDYGGKTYASLTSIAREITDAHWSGPRFFGLLKKPPGSRIAAQKSKAVSPGSAAKLKATQRASRLQHGQA